MIGLKMDVSVTVYMHDTGAEMGTILGWWHQPIKPMKIMKDDAIIDISVNKKMFIKDKDCNDSKEYQYFSKTNNIFLAASTECSAGSNDHFVVVRGGGGVPSLVQFDGRPLGGANFQY
jgi:hypothetical protein